MAVGNDCPACSENIGIWAVFRAPLPDRIYCPHCGERLRYGDTGLLIAAVVVLIAALLAASVGAAVVLADEPPLLMAGISLGIVIVGGVMLEVAFVLILWYGSYRLEAVNRSASEYEGEGF